MITMMILLQLLIDVLLVGIVVWIWLQQKKPVSVSTAPASTEELEAKVREIQLQMADLKEKVREELRQVALLCDRACRLLDQSGLSTTNTSPSQEELELKTALEVEQAQHEIPTLQHVEATKSRLRRESNHDLRTLLRGQLA